MAEETKTQTQTTEKQTNCPACNKPLKKLKRYYRNGLYYCNKKCWRAKNREKGKTDASATT